MSLLKLYMVFILIPNIQILFTGACALSIALIVLSLIFLVESDNGDEIIFKYYIKMGVFLFFISTPIALLIPNHDEMKLIVSANYLSNIKDMEKLPGNVVKKLNQYLEIK